MSGKVVFNACFGGFGLSEKAIRRARELSGDPAWMDSILPGEQYRDGSGTSSYTSVSSDLPRHDPILVRVVEELGEDASGTFGKLRVAQLSGNKYRIDEYDGSETVVEPNETEWTTIPDEPAETARSADSGATSDG